MSGFSVGSRTATISNTCARQHGEQWKGHISEPYKAGQTRLQWQLSLIQTFIALLWGGNIKCWRERKTWNTEQRPHVRRGPTLCTKDSHDMRQTQGQK